MHTQRDLLEIILALSSSGGFTSLLYGWQQKRDQDGDDGNDHQQLNQSEPFLTGISLL
jgi:hypothetical protein